MSKMQDNASVMPFIEIIETARLILKVVTPEIMAHIFSHTATPEVMELLGINSDEEFRLFKEKYNIRTASYFISYKHFLLMDKESGKFIGRCDYHTWHIHHFRAEIGYSINDGFKNRGLMKEAMKQVLTYGFEYMDLQRVEAFVSPNNAPSLGLMQHFGFTKEGVLRKHYFKDNKLEDSVCFSVLREEYLALKDKW